MWLIRLFDGGRRKPPTGPVHIGDIVAEWERVRIKGDAVVHLGAHVPDDSPQVARLNMGVKDMPGYTVRNDNVVEQIDKVPAPVAPSATAPAAPEPPNRVSTPSEQGFAGQAFDLSKLFDIAHGRGWAKEDVEDTGIGGDPTPLGGRSKRSGLCLAELTLTRPPADWSDLAARNRPPWESRDWAPPGPGWKMPGWTEPPPPVLPEAGGEGSTPPNAPIGDIGDTDKPEVQGDQGQGELEQENGNGSDGHEKPGDGDKKPPVSTSSAPIDHAGDLWKLWTPEQRAQLPEVVKVVRELAKERGAAPHPNGANFILRRGNLPTVNKDQIAAICA